MNYINWFLNVEPALHTWDKPHLVIVYTSFNTVLNWICSYFVEDFYICVYERCWSVVFFSCFKNLFIYLYLMTLNLSCFLHVLPLVAVSGGYSSLWCTNFSLQCLLLLWRQPLGAWASVIAAHVLRSCGLWGSRVQAQ